jgi:hypothetical protein
MDEQEPEPTIEELEAELKADQQVNICVGALSTLHA